MTGGELAGVALERDAGLNPSRVVPTVDARMSADGVEVVGETGFEGVSVESQPAVIAHPRERPVMPGVIAACPTSRGRLGRGRERAHAITT